MKKFLIAVMVGLMAIAAQAEATFEQIEGLIQQKNYAAAASGLEVIIQNHPKSSKAFYAMAQAQAGLGNLEKANKALTIATGLNPTLDFAPEGSVQKLKQAITPQTAKIESIEESHTMRNIILVLFVFAVGGIIYTVYRKNKEADEKYEAELKAIEEKARADREAERKRQHMEMLAQQDAERKAVLKAEDELKAHKNYNHERFDPANPDKLKTVAQFKKEQSEAAEKQRLFFEAAELREARARADAAEASARMYRTSAQAVQPTVVHTNSGSNDMLTGILVGNMLSGSHHDNTRVVEREVIREVPAPSRSSSWDDTPSTPSRSSSWDDDSSSKSSSSWSSSSSSDSSSSWSSSSDSGSSSSSSSWD